MHNKRSYKKKRIVYVQKEKKKEKKEKEKKKMHLPRLKTLTPIKCSKNLSRKRVKRVKLTPRVYMMHEKKRKKNHTT